MLATPLTAAAATLVKSIAPAGVTTAVGGAGVGRGCAVWTCSESTAGAGFGAGFGGHPHAAGDDHAADEAGDEQERGQKQPSNHSSSHPSMRPAGSALCATIARIYGHTWANLFKQNDFVKGS